MKKLVKILPILMTVMMVLMAVSPVFAGTTNPLTGINPNQGADAPGVRNVGNNILRIIQIVGSVASVGIIMVVGIKYMMGSAEQKAEYKKVMIPFIIGAVLLFAAVNIVAALNTFAGNITTGIN